MVFVDSRVIVDRACGAALLMPMREDMKTAARGACGMPIEQELMRTSS